MICQTYHLYIERKDPTKNMARFYAMEISETLFGDACLTRRWGRIGTSGQYMEHHFKTEDDAVKLFLDLTRQKKARGYRPKPTRVTGDRSRRTTQSIKPEGGRPCHRAEKPAPVLRSNNKPPIS